MKVSVLLLLPSLSALVAASDPRDLDGAVWGLTNSPGVERRQRHHRGREGWKLGGWRWNRPRPSTGAAPVLALPIPAIFPTQEDVAIPSPETIESESIEDALTVQTPVVPKTTQSEPIEVSTSTKALPVEAIQPSEPAADADAEASSASYTSSQAATPSSAPATSGWSPPAGLEAPLKEVWDHQVETYNQPAGWDKFTNYGYDTIIAARGHLNFCVRWEDPASVTASQRQAIERSLDVNVRKWTDGLTGYEGWPYQNVTSSVVGWAVADAKQLEGDTSDIVVHTTKDQEGIPECDPRCGRFFVRDGDYSECPGGTANHYDLSLWLTTGQTGGTGGDWGGRVGSEYFMANLENPHIWLHEFGHTLALDDFYDWTPTGIASFIMKAGASMEVTEFDIWMMRDWWRHLVAIPGRYAL